MFLNISFFSIWVQAYLDTTPSTSYLIILTRLNMKKGVIHGSARRNSGHLGSEQGFQEKFVWTLMTIAFTMLRSPLIKKGSEWRAQL